MTSRKLAWSLPTKNEVGSFSGNIAAWNVQVVKNVVIDMSLRRRDGVVIANKIANQISANVNSAA